MKNLFIFFCLLLSFNCFAQQDVIIFNNGNIINNIRIISTNNPNIVSIQCQNSIINYYKYDINCIIFQNSNIVEYFTNNQYQNYYQQPQRLNLYYNNGYRHNYYHHNHHFNHHNRW